MSDNIKLLEQGIISKSVSADWDAARIEWDLINISGGVSNSKCVCGTKISNVYTIKNKHNKNILQVGSECVNNINEEYDGLFKYLTNIFNDSSKRPNLKMVEFCHKNGLIADEDLEFCQLLNHKVALQRYPEVQAIRSAINDKIISGLMNQVNRHDENSGATGFLEKQTRSRKKPKPRHENSNIDNNISASLSDAVSAMTEHIERTSEIHSNGTTEHNEHITIQEFSIQSTQTEIEQDAVIGSERIDSEQVYTEIPKAQTPITQVVNTELDKQKESQVNEISVNNNEKPEQKKVYKLTDEQEFILESKNEILVINAYAGAGKTSTLLAIAKARPEHQILYLAYNREMAKEAQSKFPKNVTCRTVHSLAYDLVGRQYSKMKFVNNAWKDLKIGNNRHLEIADHINIDFKDVIIVKKALDVLNLWFSSNRLELDHSLYAEYKRTLPRDERNSLSEFDFRHLLKRSKQIWEMMKDKNNFDVKLPHDGYLKLYHLLNPQLVYDTIMLDEAQDSNDVTMAIFQRSTAKYKVVVGDTHQSIYQFRGTKNALLDFTTMAGGCFYLTKSFRFNEDIAQYATCILKELKGEKNSVKGLGAQGALRVAPCSILSFPRYTTILARKNATLFQIAVEAFTSGKKVHFSGGIEKYDLDLIKSIALLEMGESDKSKIPNFFARRFRTLEQIELYARTAEESDMNVLIKFIKELNGARTLELINELVKYDQWVMSDFAKNIVSCDYLLTTAHRSKGLEFKCVALWNDFSGLYEAIQEGHDTLYLQNKLDPVDRTAWEQEVNLYYVAATRTKNVLYVVKSDLFGLKPHMHNFFRNFKDE